MSKKAILYARVSDPSAQDSEDKVSIQKQLGEMQALCKRNSWHIAGQFVDNETYRAIQPPSKGKIVRPSGERADRPKFLEMLEVIKTGDVDAVLCWRDDRLVRHPRVAVALIDALEIGDAQRKLNGNGKGDVEIRDATNVLFERDYLQVMAVFWKKENKRRAERGRMGKQATLEQGRWPGGFRRYGYKTVREPGKRGRKIILDPDTVPIVRKVFEMYDAAMGVSEIRRYLISENVSQIYPSMCKHEWSMALINRMLRMEHYIGKATWRFSDGTTFVIDIPPIIEPELWHRVQARIDRNRQLSPRNAKGIYLLQGIACCGDCGNGMSVSRGRRFRGGYRYRCHTASHNGHEPHPRPYGHVGTDVDWAVWRQIVDKGIKRPDVICEQVRARQAELREQGESVNSEIAHARSRLTEVDQERAFFQRQGARGKITEQEFDARMGETEEKRRYWQNEIERLQQLRDDAETIQAGLDYATELLVSLQDRLAAIDQTPEELKALSKDEQKEILKARRTIIRALCDKVYLYSSKVIRIDGVLDGSEAAQFELQKS
jgi:DNA invertase Pin-like site-specific DNA recombinase